MSVESKRGQELVGTVVDGRYHIRQLLGTGNFGAVYLAEQRVFGIPLRCVALKLFRRRLVGPANATDLLNDAVVLMQLQQEPSYATAARHLVTVLDAGFLHEVPDQAYVAMEYVEGYPTRAGGTIRTLHGMIRAYRPVPVKLAIRWMTQILRPLAWMHTLNPPVLHCDLKPDNILASGRDTLKIADFGLSQLAFGTIGAVPGGGAVTCQAPETLGGILPTAAADVYALGLLFYEILAGHNPLNEVGLEELATGDQAAYLRRQLEARRAGLPPLAAGEHAELRDHPLLCGMLDRCLRFYGSERYDNAAVLLRELERYEPDAVMPTTEPGHGSRDALQSAEIAGQPTLERLLAEAAYLRDQGQNVGALARCRQAVAHYPESGAAHRLLAEVLLADGAWEEALQACAQGLRVDPGDQADLFEVSARAYEAGSRPRLASQMRERALAARRTAGA